MKAFAALYLATARQFLRDRMAILFTMLLPLLMAVFFGLIFAKEQPLNLTEVAAEAIPQAQLYVPGMLSLAILWLGVFGTAPPLVEMREKQILRRVSATPLRLTTLLAAQVAFRLSTGMAQAVLLVGYGLLVYRMEIVGGWLPLVGTTVLGSMLFITLGFLLANLAKSSDAVVAIGQVVQFPMMFLSGILFPIEMLPDFLRPVSAAMPLTYLGDALRQIMLGTAPLYPLWLNFTVLGGVLIALLILSVRFFRWE